MQSDLNIFERANDLDEADLENSVDGSVETMVGGKKISVMSKFPSKKNLPVCTVTFDDYNPINTHTSEHSKGSFDSAPPFRGGLIRFALDGGVDQKVSSICFLHFTLLCYVALNYI